MLQLADRVRQRNADDAISAERSHLAPVARADHLVSLEPEARREYSIKSGRRSAPLHVTKFCHACLQIRAALNLRGQCLANSSESIVPINCPALLFCEKCFVGMWVRVFSD